MNENTERRAKFIAQPTAYHVINDGVRQRHPDPTDRGGLYEQGAASYRDAITALNRLRGVVGTEQAMKLLVDTTHPFVGTGPKVLFEGPPAEDPRERVESKVENAAAVTRAGALVADAFTYQFFTEDGRRGRRGTNTYQALQREIADKWTEAGWAVEDEHPEAPEIAGRVRQLGLLLAEEEPRVNGVTHVASSWWNRKNGWGKEAHELFDVLFHAKRLQVEQETDGAGTISGKAEAAKMYEGLTAYKTAAGRNEKETTLTDIAEAYVAGFVTIDTDLELSGTPIGNLRLVGIDNKALLAAHITSTEELSAMTKEELLKIGHFGMNQVNAIRNKLIRHGLPTAVTEADVTSPRQHPRYANWGGA